MRLHNSRQILLYGAVLLTALAAYFAPPEDTPVQPAHPGASTQGFRDIVQADPNNHATRHTDLVPKKRSGLADEPGNLFQTEASAAVATHAAKAPAPVAPPLPYSYMGKLIEAGELTVFLTRQNKPYVIHPGDILDDQYRVDIIRPTLVEFTYLPLKQKQMLNIGASK